MNDRISPLIAARYLRAKKSHSAVTAISIVSIVGIAVATAAIVCVLSVFNGFKDVMRDKLDTLSPDIAVAPAKGKTFANTDSLLTVLRSDRRIEIASPVVADNALIIANNHEMPVMLKGVVSDDYKRLTAIDSLFVDEGQLATSEETPDRVRYVYDDDIGDYVETPAEKRYKGAVAIGVATRTGQLAKDGSLLIFTPRREGRVNLANPATSFLTDSITVSGVFQTNQGDFDNDYVITDIDLARELFQYTDEATGVEIKVRQGVKAADVASDLAASLGEAFVVKDRLQQQGLNFRMISIEKWVTFLLLTFILIVASFNVISTLSMLVLEKQDSLMTMRALGMSRKRIGRVFSWESIYVTLIGCLSGLVVGVILCLLQQRFGFIKLNADEANLIIKSYPVSVHYTDIAVAMIPIILIGFATACISARFARSRI